jgi:bifunctional DNA-binding transcriptional regulator/antitoxin component of YhaV-PrlF toxin-antitoxin module
MTVTVKNNSPITVPETVQRRAGIKSGDRLEFKVSAGVITIVPKPPASNCDYTPAQRRLIDGQIAEGLDDIRKGRVSPRFETVDEMLASLKGSSGKPASRRKKPDGR